MLGNDDTEVNHQTRFIHRDLYHASSYHHVSFRMELVLPKNSVAHDVIAASSVYLRYGHNLLVERALFSHIRVFIDHILQLGT